MQDTIESDFQVVLEAVPDAILVVERGGTITVANRQAEALFGYQRDELIGNSLAMLLPERIRERYAQQFAQYVAEPHVRPMGVHVELFGRHKDGSEFSVEISLSPVGSEANLHVISIIRDITARKEAEQALHHGLVRARDAAETAQEAAETLADLQQDLTTMVNHELRTPLTAMMGFAQILVARWDDMPESQRLKYVTSILRAANRQYRLLNDLRQLNQLDANVLAITCTTTLIAPLAQEAAEEVQASYPGQQIRLEGPVDLRARLNPDRTIQILVNLLDNAAKYSPEGSPIDVSWGQENQMVVVRVHDHGFGIQPADRDKLFIPFGRLQGSSARAGHVSTGLGLYLSRQLTQLMGGGLDLEVTGPEGSIFRIGLPVAEPVGLAREDALEALREPEISDTLKEGEAKSEQWAVGHDQASPAARTTAAHGRKVLY